MMTINELVDRAHTNAKEKGWHDERVSSLEAHALIHSEVSEATEAAREGLYPICQIEKSKIREGAPTFILPDNHWSDEAKPEGEAIELADAVIRIADYFGARGWDLQQAIELKMAYNETRPYRHGGKIY